MNKIYIKLLLSLIFFVNLSFAQKGELLITTQKNGNNIDILFELLNESNVVGFQFDLKLPKSQLNSIDISSCTKSFSKSALAGCSLNNNTLRVAVINNGLADMKSGETGRITIKNSRGVLASELQVTNVRIGNKKGEEVAITAVIDYSDVKFDKYLKPKKWR